jgi:hypothetical protein
MPGRLPSKASMQGSSVRGLCSKGTTTGSPPSNYPSTIRQDGFRRICERKVDGVSSWSAKSLGGEGMLGLPWLTPPVHRPGLMTGEHLPILSEVCAAGNGYFWGRERQVRPARHVNIVDMRQRINGLTVEGLLRVAAYNPHTSENQTGPPPLMMPAMQGG